MIRLAHQSNNLQCFHLGIRTSAAFLRFTPCIAPDTIHSQVVLPLSTLSLLPPCHALHMWSAFPRLYQPGLRFFSRPLFLFLQLTTVCSTCFANTVCPPHLRLQLGCTHSFSLFFGQGPAMQRPRYLSYMRPANILLVLAVNIGSNLYFGLPKL